MTTTTIRIDGALKSRLAAIAADAGVTAHAFIVAAIEQSVEQAELAAEMHRVAEARWGRLIDTGRSVAWDDAKAYLVARAAGGRSRRPVPRKPAR